MSVDYSAVLAYGVRLEPEEVNRFYNTPNYENILDEWAIHASYYSANADYVIGIVQDTIYEGESIEVCLSMPSEKELYELQDALNQLGINREPTWHLICQVS